MISASLTASAARDARSPASARVSPIRPPESGAASSGPALDDEALEAARRANREARRIAQREALRPIVLAVLPPMLGLVLFLGLWTFIAQTSPDLPGPAKVWHSAVKLFSDPFYRKSPNDQAGGSAGRPVSAVYFSSTSRGRTVCLVKKFVNSIIRAMAVLNSIR